MSEPPEAARPVEPWAPAVLAHGPAIRLLPRLDDTNRFFWTSGADGRLRFLRCGQCRRYFHPPQPRCPWCLADQVAPEAVSGRGTVVSFTCNVHPWIPDSDPYLLGLVAIDEQPDIRLTTNLIDVSFDRVTCGLAVEVDFEQHDDVFLPLFRPAADRPASDRPASGPPASGPPVSEPQLAAARRGRTEPGHHTEVGS